MTMRAAAAGIVRVTSRARPQHDRPGRGREAYSRVALIPRIYWASPKEPSTTRQLCGRDVEITKFG